jgi:hypothetical protein
MWAMKATLLFVTIVSACNSQTTGPADTKGACSPANTGNNNTFNITCQGISDKLGAQLIELLNRVAKNQAGAETMMAKLDGCLEGVREVREQQASRHLTDQQERLLLTALSPFKGTRVTVEATEGDEEAYRYAQEFATLFRNAGFTLIAFAGNAGTTGVNTMMIVGGPPVTGLVLHPMDESEWRTPIFQVFDRTLLTTRVQHSAQYVGKMRVKDTDLEVFIGSKPRD